jgi:hypothetical protein
MLINDELFKTIEIENVVTNQTEAS